MSTTRISNNQIANTTSAIIDALNFLDGESVLRLPSGTTSQQPSGPSVGTLRFNTENDSAEIYVSDAGEGSAGWTSVGGGGGPSLGEDSVIRTSKDTIDQNITIGATAGDEFVRAMSIGPITIASGVTVTIENNAVWTII